MQGASDKAKDLVAQANGNKVALDDLIRAAQKAQQLSDIMPDLTLRSDEIPC